MPRQKDPLDEQIGFRIRSRRMQLGLSQTALGDALNVTFQQVQKYEKGTNRCSGSKLSKLCQVLDCTIADLMAGIPGTGGPSRGEAFEGALAFAGDTKYAAELVKLWPSIDFEGRRLLLQVAKQQARITARPTGRQQTVAQPAATR